MFFIEFCRLKKDRRVGGGLHLQIQLELLGLVRVVVPLREYLVGESYDAPKGLEFLSRVLLPFL